MAEKTLREYSLPLLARTPHFIRHILIAGDDILPSVLLFHKRNFETLWVLTNNQAEADYCRSACKSVTIEPFSASPQLPVQQRFDAVLLTSPIGLQEQLARLRACFSAQTQLLVLCANPHYWKHARQGKIGPTLEEVRSQASTQGFHLYQQWFAEDTEFLLAPQNSQGNVQIGQTCIPVVSEEARIELSRPLVFMQFVPRGYNPVQHAHECCDTGHPEYGYEILASIPQSFRTSSDVQTRVGVETLYCLAQWIKRAPETDPLEFFTCAQRVFSEAIERNPAETDAYIHQAEIWNLMGDPDMAARVLRSIQQVSQDITVQNRPSRSKTQDHDDAAPYSAPEWNPARGPRKILFVIPPRPHYGLDVLYDGLCTILGAETIIDFPQKPFLHGQRDDEFAHYGCFFNHPALNYSFEHILDLLQRNQIDCILYGDCERALDPVIGQTLAKTAKDIPIFLVDQLDESANMREKTCEYLGNAQVAGYFKREMLMCGHYGPNAFPLPFAYPDARIPNNIESPRTRPLFWAGHQRAGLRRLYLENLAAKRNLHFTERFSPQEYGRILLETQIGLNFFGFGFDTLRFWELPAHGCLLLSERLPIHIPHPFQDGQEAVFFDDLEDLHQHLDYYLDHPEKAAAIAHAGHKHLLQHHTASARARQLLGWIQSLQG